MNPLSPLGITPLVKMLECNKKMSETEIQKELDSLYENLDTEIQSRKGIKVGIIKSMELSTLGETIGLENLRNPKNAGNKCLNMSIETPEGYEIKQTMTISSHSNSNMEKYRKTYGERPKVDGEIPLRYNEDSGFWEVAL